MYYYKSFDVDSDILNLNYFVLFDILYVNQLQVYNLLFITFYLSLTTHLGHWLEQNFMV
jgi:hypothetical protein